MRPHRGILVFVLGILGLICFQPLGVVAWILGSGDLKAIASGQMNPEGKSLTQAGMILGIIATVLLALAIFGVVLAIIVSLLAGNR